MSSFFEKLRGSTELTPKQGQTEKPSMEKKQSRSKTDKVKVEKTTGKKLPKDWGKAEGKLAIDVYQTDTHIVIQSPIAGVRKENLHISIENDVVVIRGGREKSDMVEEENYFHQECYWGPFSREIILPVEGDASRAEATMRDAILTLKIPKSEREKKRKVEVE